MQQWDAIVIGAGTAGLSAAQMLGRARRRTLVVDAGEPRNRFAAHMHGVLGQDGTPPGDLLARGRAELAAYPVEVRAASVIRVDETSSIVAVTLDDGTVETARALVVATGITDDLPDIPGLADRWGTTVLHCPYCHGWEVRDRRLGVLLVSAAQLHQAQLIRQWSDDVTVFTGVIGDLDPDAEKRLRSRGVKIEPEPVVRMDDGRVHLRDGRTVPIDAIFTAGTPRLHDDVLSHLSLERTPEGTLAVYMTGKTSSARIWAAGNVVAPFANVPMSMGAGSMAGAAVNAALVDEDFRLADPGRYWEHRYEDRLWSGRPNRTLVDLAGALTPGRSLDLGCGEGADVLWLAEQGWDATGVDISASATARASDAAEGLSARFVAADLDEWDAAESYDLVTASFLHSPVALDRARILRRAADRVAPDGHLLLISHGAPPPWAPAGHAHHVFPTADEERDALSLDPAEWTTVIAGSRTREATSPDGVAATLDDTVVMLRRRGLPTIEG